MFGLGSRSAYDGRSTQDYKLVVNGREVTVRSSWRPGDPDRDKASGGPQR